MHRFAHLFAKVSYQYSLQMYCASSRQPNSSGAFFDLYFWASSFIMSPQLLKLSTSLLQQVLGFKRSADSILRDGFRAQRVNAKQRTLVADAVYGVLRHLGVLRAWTQTEDSKSLLLAWFLRVRGMSLRELTPLLSVEDQALAQSLKTRPLLAVDQATLSNLPDWLWRLLCAQYGESETIAMARAMQSLATLDLRVNTLKASRQQILATLQQAGIGATITPFSPSGLRIKTPISLEETLLQDGSVEVQDEGSQLIGLLVGAKRGMMVADFCAGAGGKSLQLGALMHNTGRLYAFELSETRLVHLGKRLRRSGLSNLQAQRIDSEHDGKLKRLRGKFDRVLVDAPCSGLGTLRRAPCLKWRWKIEDIQQFSLHQSSILQAAAKLVKVGGRLIYATCSILETENQQVAQSFLDSHNDFSLCPAGDILRTLDVALDSGQYLQLLPHLHATDGFFAAIFERKF